ncbi:MAG: peptidylprolyl isomerase, partial [Mycobacteriales bacterium]
MPGSKRQRELAHRRAERQAIRRREAAARRRKQRFIIGASGIGVLALLLTVFFVVQRNDDDKKPDDAAATASAEPKEVACGASAPTAAEPQRFPSAPPMTIDPTKKYVATIKTSCGEVVVDLAADKAPETINSFNFLAGKKFFDGSPCHRMLASEQTSVLQCGDPTGTGRGELGYNLKDENLPTAVTPPYPAGTLAMANSGRPNSGGSQFFFVIKESSFQPDYAVVGKVTKGLDVLEKILAIGDDGAFEPQPGGGAPNQRVFIESFTVTA